MLYLNNGIDIQKAKKKHGSNSVFLVDIPPQVLKQLGTTNLINEPCKTYTNYGSLTLYDTILILKEMAFENNTGKAENAGNQQLLYIRTSLENCRLVKD